MLVTTDKAREFLEACERVYDGSDSIYEGLTILKKYHKDRTFHYSLEHEQMWVGAGDFDEYIEVMSDEDIIRMGQLGWMEDEDSWRHSDYAG